MLLKQEAISRRYQMIPKEYEKYERGSR